jgi:Putative Ig domain/IPTL-CTERM motif
LVTTNGNNAAAAIATLTVVALCPIVTVSPGALPGGIVGTPYNQTISASPPGTYTLSLLTGSLPAGLSLNSSTGAITGTPTTIGSSNFTIAGTNASGCAGTQAYTVNVAPAAIASPGEPIPTLSEWAMIVLAALMAFTGFAVMRRRGDSCVEVSRATSRPSGLS